jgi:hypothetical protein
MISHCLSGRLRQAGEEGRLIHAVTDYSWISVNLGLSQHRHIWLHMEMFLGLPHSCISTHSSLLCPWRCPQGNNTLARGSTPSSRILDSNSILQEENKTMQEETATSQTEV